MHNAVIQKSLYEDIVAFCEVNEITDIDQFINETLKKGFDMKKYGDSFAFFFNKSENDIVHIKDNQEETKIEQEVVEVKEEVFVEPVVAPKKKVGRKKKEEPKIEETVVEPELTVEPEPVDEQPKEPAYKIKEEVVKPEKKYVSLRNKKDDNYDVYDTI